MGAMEDGSPVRRLPRLPACRACHQRKVKCDNNRPKCAPCTRNGVRCILIFPGAEHELVSREDLYLLEQREQALARGAETEEAKPEAGPEPIHAAGEADTGRAPSHSENANGNTAASTGETAGYPDSGPGQGFGSVAGAGAGSLPPQPEDAEWRKSHAHLRETLGRTTKASEAPVEAHAMPSAEAVYYFFKKYLAGSHVQNPFFLRHEVHELYTRVFPVDTGRRASAQDLYRTFMILAIATVVPYRRGQHPHHPIGYYLAAMQHFSADFLATRLDCVQDLLLICRFGIYYHIGTSIWDTIQLCGRLCIELGLHRPRDGPADLLQEQIERRVFWEFYMLDRYSSTTISRPFALADRDITVPFCADAEDDDILAARSLGTAADLDEFMQRHSPQGPTETSVFLQCVRLRTISSRIQTEFTQLAGATTTPPLLLTGRLYALLDDILRALDVWRRTAPVFPQPRCIFEMTEWYDLLLARERMQAVRKAMDLAPKHDGQSSSASVGLGSGLPARHLLALCLDAASKTIRLYAGLFHSHMVTYTRSYFHTVFTAGLSVMFCCCASQPAAVPTSSSTTNTPQRIRASREVLVLCAETLAHMGAQLPDARGYVVAFEELHKSVARKLDQALEEEECREREARDQDGQASQVTHAGQSNASEGLEPPGLGTSAGHAVHPGLSHAQSDQRAGLDHERRFYRGSSTANVNGHARAQPLAHVSLGHLPPPPSHIDLDIPMDGSMLPPLSSVSNVSTVSTSLPAHSLTLPPYYEQPLSGSFGHVGGVVGSVTPAFDAQAGQPITPHMPYGAPARNELLQWAFLSDDTMWNVVGEYVYGDPNDTWGLFPGLDMGMQ